MTSLEAIETYSCHHSETFEELLEWPYRRFIKAFSAWQRRNAVDGIDNRKNLHVQAYHSIVEWSKPEDQKEAIDNVEKYYELLKDHIWDPNKMEKENSEMRVLESKDSFLAAGKRNLKKILPPKFPGQNEIEDRLE